MHKKATVYTVCEKRLEVLILSKLDAMLFSDLNQYNMHIDVTTTGELFVFLLFFF